MNLAPYVVGQDGPFGPAQAAYLLRRAGFGATLAERDEAVRNGLPATVAAQFTLDEGRSATQFAASGVQAAEQCSGSEKLGEELPPLQGAWLGRMVATRAPLAEKLALFWHGHFATSIDKVQLGVAMWRQYELLRAQGAGRFALLVDAVARDPAMLHWLDGNSNEKTAPNENFARELFELFTLGIGHYSEHDIREAARCFTGWHLKAGRYWRNERAHDPGRKRVLGRDGLEDGAEVVAVAAEQPACARFVASKLLRAFVTDSPDDASVEEVAAALREEQLDIGATLRRLFASRLFFAPHHRRARIAGPVEWAVGLLRRVGGRAKWSALGGALAEMGQSLFQPPNVKGWDGGRAWISSRTLLARGRFAAEFAYGGGFVVAVDWERIAGDTIAGDGIAKNGGALVATLADVLLDGQIEASTRARLVAFADSAEGGSGAERAMRVAQLLVSAPEALLQ